jgi:hypothetical protein
MGFYTDPALTLCTAQAAASAMAITTGTVSANVIDTQSSPTTKDLGILPMIVRFIVTEAFTAANDGGGEFTSLNIAVKSSTLEALTGGTTTTHVARDVAVASLTLGAEFSLVLPPGTYQRYLGAWFTSTAELATAGKITAVVVPAVDSRQWFPDGSSIS